MPLDIRSFPYGNLQAYKTYIRPNLNRILFGDYNSYRKIPKNKHAENIIHLLTVMAKYGAGTTWEIAKKQKRNNIEGIRTKEKEYRRLIIGRDDKKKHNPGLLEQSVIVQSGVIHNRGGPAAQYRLSLHGVLCCMDIFDFSDTEIDILAATYSEILPKVFGQWDFLKSIIGKEVYKIRILSKGIIADNMIPFCESDYPLYEIMSFIHIKYQQKSENITEQELAEQISLWFYTNLLYNSIKNTANNKEKATDETILTSKLSQVLVKDPNLKKWYDNFLKEIKKYHKKNYFVIKNFHLL